MNAIAAAHDWSFETPRVRARLADERDRALYLALYTDPAVMALIDAPMDAAGAEAFFGRVCRWNLETPPRARFWRLSSRDDDAPIGQLSMLRVDSEPGCVEVGQMLLPERQGQGIGVEVARVFAALLMRDHWGLGVEILVARHAPANLPVRRIGESLGYRPQDAAEAGTGWRLTRADWLAHHSQ